MSKVLTEGTIYILSRFQENDTPYDCNYSTTKEPCLIIEGTGSVDIYGSEKTPTTTADMILDSSANVAGYYPFSLIPKYFTVVANGAGTRTCTLKNLSAIPK